MTSLPHAVLKMIARRLLGVILIALCYFTAFLVLVALSDPFSPKPPRMSNASLATIALVMAAAVWSASGVVIGKFMMTPRRKAFRPWMAYVYAAIILFTIPAISALLVWGF